MVTDARIWLIDDSTTRTAVASPGAELGDGDPSDAGVGDTVCPLWQHRCDPAPVAGQGVPSQAGCERPTTGGRLQFQGGRLGPPVAERLLDAAGNLGVLQIDERERLSGVEWV